MKYKDFIIRKIGNQFFAYYQGKTKGFTALAKGGQLSLLGDYFLSLAAIQSSIRAFHNKKNRMEFIIGEVYQDGYLWLVGYHTGHKNGAEIEFTNQTFTNKRSAMTWILDSLDRFTDLILFRVSVDKPLELVQVY